jgi:Flp pilus assembly protein TadG
MRGGLLGRLLKSERAAVAPTIGLSLFALIGMGGIAFDYARLASMDSELQNAADQAALAAASQLDGELNARTRATTAARTLITNITRMANDGDTSAVTVPTITFYVDSGTAPGTVATTDEDAHFVKVTVGAREAFYALTPVVAAFSSGDIEASAYAGVGSAVCKVPPVMMCNPDEGVTGADFPNTDPTSADTDVGRGIRLVAGGSGGSWAPGNFGYLETGIGSGASALEQALGANVPPGDCLDADSVTTKPGLNTSVTDAINTRFDIFENGLVNYCDEEDGLCSPAMNTRKDVVHSQITSAPPSNCGFATGNDPWILPSVQYLPDPTTRLPTATPTNMGLPRDICHAVSSAGDCANGRIGDRNWDRTNYFAVNHPSSSASVAAAWAGVSESSLTRYDVYRWELAVSGGTAARQAYSVPQGNGNGNGNTTNYYSYSAPQCSTGLAPSETQQDRRVLTVAVVNCNAEGVNGQTKGVDVYKWVEVFLVEPSIARPRTDAADIYIEIVREAQTAGESGTFQVVRRDVPYLIE